MDLSVSEQHLISAVRNVLPMWDEWDIDNYRNSIAANIERDRDAGNVPSEVEEYILLVIDSYRELSYEA